MKTTEPGYVNRNGQINISPTHRPGTDHGQSVYVLRCPVCKRNYGANGSDIFQRKCPFHQGGRPGLPLRGEELRWRTTGPSFVQRMASSWRLPLALRARRLRRGGRR